METYTPSSFVAWGDDFLLFPRINIRSVSRTSVTHLCPTYSRTVRFAIVRNDPSPSTDSQLPLHLFCFVQFFEFQRPLLFRPLSPFNLVLPFLSNECTRIVPRFRSINPHSNPVHPEDYIRIFLQKGIGGDEKVIKRKGKGKSRLIA